MDETIERITAAIARIDTMQPLGRVTTVGTSKVAIQGLGTQVQLGDRVEIIGENRSWRGEVITIAPDHVTVLPETDIGGISIGLRAAVISAPHFAPSADWIGRALDPDGLPLDGVGLVPAACARDVIIPAPAANDRRAMGGRFATGLALFDTVLPIVQGQRVGLFAGSGVGKSTLMGEMARKVDADVIVIGLVGERGRELREFVENVLGAQGLARSVVIAATSDRAPQTRRRCAWSAMAVAEYFRDQGKQVLLLLDSVTRFAEAHREICVASGENADLRGYPASTAANLAALCERAGPGVMGQGDITAIFTVLVAGSDMEEPVADMLRGVLDGHVVMDRQIAERGRFPAVDVLRSVSRSLPGAASDAENALICEMRQILGTYAQAELMIQAGLYTAGSDPNIDRAIALYPKLEKFQELRISGGSEASFAALRTVLSSA